MMATTTHACDICGRVAVKEGYKICYECHKAKTASYVPCQCGGRRDPNYPVCYNCHKAGVKPANYDCVGQFSKTDKGEWIILVTSGSHAEDKICKVVHKDGSVKRFVLAEYKGSTNWGAQYVIDEELTD